MCRSLFKRGHDIFTSREFLAVATTSPKMMLVGILVVSLALLAGTGEALKWKQCGSKANVLVNNVDLTPQPMKMPGNGYLTLDVNILKQLNGSDATITIRRSTFLGYIRIPCLFEVGSCTYKDTCTLMQRMMSENWGGFLGPIITQMVAAFNAVGAQIDCPVPKQRINLNKIPMKLPKIPAYMTFLARGDYRIELHTKDKKDGKSVLCLEWDMTVG